MGYAYFVNLVFIFQTMEIRVSKCCNCKVAVSGRGDFHNRDEDGTFFYYCLHCLQACDTKLVEKKPLTKQYE